MAGYCPIQDQKCRDDCELLAYSKNPEGRKCAFGAIAHGLELMEDRLEAIRQEVAV